MTDKQLEVKCMTLHLAQMVIEDFTQSVMDAVSVTEEGNGDVAKPLPKFKRGGPIGLKYNAEASQTFLFYYF